MIIWAVYDGKEFQIAYPREIMCKVYISGYSDAKDLTIRKLTIMAY